MKYTIKENNEVKALRSSFYNYAFNKTTGYFMRWGKNMGNDPQFSPFGPEICDVEASTVCHGPNNKPCKFCYKSNSSVGKNMSLETFKQILPKMGRQLTQVALGIGSIDSNPDLYRIMEYCRNNDYNEVIPNITINGYRMNDYHYDRLANLAGAVACSHYGDDEVCFTAIQRLSKAGLAQCNIHKLLCRETLSDCLLLLEKAKNKEIEGLNAIVFLLLKPKGKRNNLTQLRELDEFKKLIDYALDNEVPIGFDSCSAPSVLRAFKDRPNYDNLEQLVEPCESQMFSTYLNVEGKCFYCSFTEGEPGWEGIDILKCDDFLTDVWYHPESRRFREMLLENQRATGVRHCPIYDLEVR